MMECLFAISRNTPPYQVDIKGTACSTETRSGRNGEIMMKWPNKRGTISSAPPIFEMSHACVITFSPQHCTPPSPRIKIQAPFNVRHRFPAPPKSTPIFGYYYGSSPAHSSAYFCAVGLDHRPACIKSDKFEDPSTLSWDYEPAA